MVYDLSCLWLRNSVLDLSAARKREGQWQRGWLSVSLTGSVQLGRVTRRDGKLGCLIPGWRSL